MIDVLIIGGGPAGVSAALYTARAGFSTTIIYNGYGALEKAERVDNFYGRYGVAGVDLIKDGLEQAKNVGARIISGEVIKIRLADDFSFIAETAEAEYPARTMLFATGVSRKAPKIPGLAEYEGKGVSYCAVCDAFFYRGKDVAVLGNSQYALSEVRELLPIASSVTLLTNGEKPDVKFPPEVKKRTDKIKEIKGDKIITGVAFESKKRTYPISGLFIAQGTAGGADLARKMGAAIENNDVITDAQRRTNIPGLWAAGDCTAGMKQIAKAVYDGAAAGMDIVKYLRGEQE